ncbi:MAG TPA: hypothetical protein VN905_14045 [Candidatus Binatia bacterium]|nr:hypothetical protein [Candidatus Binatia bacterium]
MTTRRRRFFAVLFAVAILPSAALAQPTPAPLRWEMVIDRATYDVEGMDPPTLPAPPGRIAVRYQWQENDKIVQWWQQVVSGSRDPKNVIIYVKRGNAKKAIISYALDGVQLRDFRGPALSREGGYSGPSTAVLTFQTVRVLPK